MAENGVAVGHSVAFMEGVNGNAKAGEGHEKNDEDASGCGGIGDGAVVRRRDKGARNCEHEIR